MLDKFVHHGPEFHKPVSTDSLGIQLYNSFVKRADQVAFVDANTREEIKYRKLLEVTCRLAEALKNIGLQQNDVVSVQSENNLNFFYPVVAAFYNGMIVATINNSYIGNELLHVLNISHPKILFCSKLTLKKGIEAKSKCSSIQHLVVLDSPMSIGGVLSLDDFIDKYSDKYLDEYSFRPLAFDTVKQSACILCSSGTTGLPKGVLLSHYNLSVRLTHAEDPRFELVEENAPKLGFLPFFHGYGFVTVVTYLCQGAKIVVLSKFDETSFMKTIQDYKIGVITVVPPIMVVLAKSSQMKHFDLSSLKEISVGAAPVPKEVEDEIRKRLPTTRLRQGYGLTEATQAIMLPPIGQEKSGSTGTILPGMSVKIRDPDTGKTLGVNTVGELCFKGGMVMQGYYGNPSATESSFTEDGWLLSGDLGYFDEQGYFYIVDRMKELIKYKGFQVAPAEVEALLLTHPKILDAGVVGVADEAAGEVAMAFVVKRPKVALTEEEIKEFVAKQVSNPKRLHGGVEFIDRIPKNASGKILRRELRQLVKTVQKSKL